VETQILIFQTGDSGRNGRSRKGIRLRNREAINLGDSGGPVYLDGGYLPVFFSPNRQVRPRFFLLWREEQDHPELKSPDLIFERDGYQKSWSSYNLVELEVVGNGR